jgi:4-deoxy-L-threo-5-hexosulose-uronate ketol-isomerase
MEFRPATHPEDARGYDTQRLRARYHVARIFTPGVLKTVYAYEDRMVVGGACPQGELRLGEAEEVGAKYFLERRELATINIGAKGSVRVDGAEYAMDHFDGLYVGLGAKEVSFKSADPGTPAKFYFNSTPAQHGYPTTKIEFKKLKAVSYGSEETASKRSIYSYVVPGAVESCQLTMGLTMLEKNNVWNTMPPHLHDRRMEVYFYFDLPDDAVVFHFMGRPDETRHIVVRNEEAVLSPCWSLHSGVGTRNYTFIWGMGGENKIVPDVKGQPMASLR